MAQQTGMVNFLIHDTNGNPQYIKVQTGQSNKIKTIPQEAVKTILSQKSGTVAQVVNAPAGAVIPHGAQLLRTLNIHGKQKLVTIPVQTPIQNLLKPGERNTVTPNKPFPVQLTASPIMIQANSKNFHASLLDHSGSSRKRQENENDFVPEYSGNSKRRKTEKNGKGLRHFSMKVCEKVRKKGTTSYNEVADELVAEFTNPNLVPNSVDQQYDQKNIRRRVYDALNVLMAMNIISKEKKEIRWLGLPTNSQQECVSLVTEKKKIAERIKEKTQQLNELLLQQISFRNLVQRNSEMERVRGPPAPNTTIHLPFIVVNSDRKTIIDCSITNDKREYLFVFNDKFEIHDDFEILKQIGLTMGLEKGAISDTDLERIKAMLPKQMEKYVTKLAQERRNNFCDEDIGAGPSEAHDDSTLGETTDEESNVSTDIEVN